jgi:hypothetical protein
VVPVEAQVLRHPGPVFTGITTESRLRRKPTRTQAQQAGSKGATISGPGNHDGLRRASQPKGGRTVTKAAFVRPDSDNAARGHVLAASSSKLERISSWRHKYL